jgi:hypothetical protein
LATKTKEKPTEKDVEAKLEETKEAEQKLDEEINLLDSVALAVDRELTLGGETRTYVQHEMGFLTKIKFFRLLSSTIRRASEDTEGGTSAFLNELFGTLGEERDRMESANAMFGGILRLVELAPEFIEEAYMYALNVPIQERNWAIAALEELDDDEGIDILEVFVAQNGESIHDFFTKRLKNLGQRIGQVFGAQEQQETTP